MTGFVEPVISGLFVLGAALPFFVGVKSDWVWALGAGMPVPCSHTLIGALHIMLVMPIREIAQRRVAFRAQNAK